MYSHLTPSVPRIGFSPTTTLMRIKLFLKARVLILVEYLNQKFEIWAFLYSSLFFLNYMLSSLLTSAICVPRSLRLSLLEWGEEGEQMRRKEEVRNDSSGFKTAQKCVKHECHDHSFCAESAELFIEDCCHVWDRESELDFWPFEIDDRGRGDAQEEGNETQGFGVSKEEKRRQKTEDNPEMNTFWGSTHTHTHSMIMSVINGKKINK